VKAPVDEVVGPQHSVESETAVRLGAVLGRLVRTLRRAHVSALSSASMSALATVVRDGPTRLGDLAEREGVTPATLSRIVTALEREGYTQRRTDPADRRVAFLSATPTGERAVNELLAARADVLVSRIAALSPQELAALVAGLDVLERLATADPPTR
jgi:DNA-binding MarR family transcriptional regulator